MTHITFGVDQGDPYPEQQEETGDAHVLIGDIFRRDEARELGDWCGDDQEQAIDEIVLFRSAREEADQTLRHQRECRDFDQCFKGADDEEFDREHGMCAELDVREF